MTCRDESEAGVIPGMSDDNDDFMAKIAASSESFPCELRADSLVLEFWEDRHRGQGQNLDIPLRGFDVDPAEKDVSHDLRIFDCYKGEFRNEIL